MDLTATAEAALQTRGKTSHEELGKRGKELLGGCLSRRRTVVVSSPHLVLLLML